MQGLSGRRLPRQPRSVRSCRNQPPWPRPVPISGGTRFLRRKVASPVAAARTARLHEGFVRVDRLPAEGGVLPPRPATRDPRFAIRGQGEVQLLKTAELRPRGHHIVRDCAVEDCVLRRTSDLVRRVRLLGVDRLQDAGARQPGGRLPGRMFNESKRRPVYVLNAYQAGCGGRHRDAIGGAASRRIRRRRRRSRSAGNARPLKSALSSVATVGPTRR